eukprot:10467433-Heterocapsa_arctica.AAC.1
MTSSIAIGMPRLEKTAKAACRGTEGYAFWMSSKTILIFSRRSQSMTSAESSRMALTNSRASRLLLRGLKPHCVAGSSTEVGSPGWTSPSRCARRRVATILARRRVITESSTVRR